MSVPRRDHSEVIVSVSSRPEAVETGERFISEKAKSIAAVTLADVSFVMPKSRIQLHLKLA